MKHNVGLPNFEALREWATRLSDDALVHVADDECVVKDAELRRLWKIETAALGVTGSMYRRSGMVFAPSADTFKKIAALDETLQQEKKEES
jgi:hypothetical protein